MKDKYYFYDKNHGNCLRILYKINKNEYTIIGGYGSDEGKKGNWSAKLIKKENFIKNGQKFNAIIDFNPKSKKTHGNIYHAYWSNRKIHWQDGNTWLELYF